MWKLIHGNRSNKSSEVIPPGRHSHTAVLFDQAMWVYGGMTDLTERSDLWKFDLGKAISLQDNLLGECLRQLISII